MANFTVVLLPVWFDHAADEVQWSLPPADAVTFVAVEIVSRMESQSRGRSESTVK